MSVKIGKIECHHEIDPYHRNTNGLTLTVLNIYPKSRKCNVSQDYDDNATSMNCWNGIDIEKTLHNTLDSVNVREFLESDDGQNLLDRICNGHDVEWNGSNHIGSLDDDAELALSDLIVELENCFTDEAEWLCGDYFSNCSDDELGIYKGMPDVSIKKLANRLQSECNEYLIDDVESYLKNRVNDIEDN